MRVRLLLPELGTAADRAESPTGVEEDGIPRALGARDTGFNSLDADCYRAVVLGTPDRLQICRRSGSIPDGPAPPDARPGRTTRLAMGRPTRLRTLDSVGSNPTRVTGKLV